MKKFRVIRNRKVQRRQLAVRRFMTVSLILGLFVFVGYNMRSNRLELIEEATAQLEYYESKLSNVRIRQGYYENEIVKLDNEDYVAMLAREHLLSMPNETVFIIKDSEVMSESGEENFEN